jgi:hypothetical protein
MFKLYWNNTPTKYWLFCYPILVEMYIFSVKWSINSERVFIGIRNISKLDWSCGELIKRFFKTAITFDICYIENNNTDLLIIESDKPKQKIHNTFRCPSQLHFTCRRRKNWHWVYVSKKGTSVNNTLYVINTLYI